MDNLKKTICKVDNIQNKVVIKEVNDLLIICDKLFEKELINNKNVSNLHSKYRIQREKIEEIINKLNNIK